MLIVFCISVLNKEFEVPPYSQSVVLGQQVELRCHPPEGTPPPRVGYSYQSECCAESTGGN